MLETNEPNVKPVTAMENVLLFIRKNIAYLGILIVMILGLLYLLTMGGCEKGISVPNEWVSEYNSHYRASRGSESYSFFANLVRSLTQKPFIKYNLDELASANYNAERDDYLWNETNIERETYRRDYPLPNNEVYHDLCTFQLSDSRSTRDYREIFLNNLERMKRYGIYSYSGIDRYKDFGPENRGFSLFFRNSLTFRQDSEILLNTYFPYNDPQANPPYQINQEKTRLESGKLYLDLQANSSRFNDDLLFRVSATPRNDVLNGRSDIGFYLKYKDDSRNLKPGFRETDLNIGKVYQLWSPNIPRRELLWLYNEYIAAAAERFQSNNPFISLNHHWLPDKYPYVAEEVLDALARVDQEKQVLAQESTGESYQIYYDHNDMSDFVNLITSRSDTRVRFVKARSMPPEALLKELDSNPPPLIYIYGVSLHSIYNLPTEVVSRSFWYNSSHGDELLEDVDQHIKTFGMKISASGQIDPREFQQYADLEGELSIGSRANRKGGLHPLFTVPYAMIYKENAIKSIKFNTTRGFIELIYNRPQRVKRD